MKWTRIEENWQESIPFILARWPDMDEEKLEEMDGDEAGFLAYLAEVESLDEEEAEEELGDFLENMDEREIAGELDDPEDEE
ncbi:hypothetical protein [Pseudoroseicyclus tamaricis]|uniref:Uncharacterized protein n=1 Tax=Pseudoroseicyclus tamaricis TaxID=2705421 RepID=A0A6B2JS98_9RHOB|nr:hypothetical protein [Pseudoroseicyclus tamaricis]NDV00885.1 hypothetical protein [Pseudoroseicyclus tamaricis]